MSINKLKIVDTAPTTPQSSAMPPPSIRKQNLHVRSARMERLWLLFPERFDPNRNCRERARLRQTLALMTKHRSIAGSSIVDVGCGEGSMARMLCNLKANVTAVDASSNALKALDKKGGDRIATAVEILPDTHLPDGSFDIVICTDVIGDIDPRDHRILFSELARLVKQDGIIVFSTPLDVKSDDAVEKLALLAHTELVTLEWKFGCHRLHLFLSDLLKAPKRYTLAGKNPDYLSLLKEGKTPLKTQWIQMNSRPYPSKFWKGISMLIRPLVYWLDNSERLLNILEWTSKAIWHRRGATHALFIGKRKKIE